MNMPIKSFSLPFALIALLGCATTPITTQSAIQVSRDRILEPKYLEQKPGTELVVIKRDTGFGGSACSSRVFLDAVPIADLNVGEKVVLYLPIGEYLLGAKPNGICGGGLSETQAIVRAGRPLTFRIGYGSNGDFSIQPTAF